MSMVGSRVALAAYRCLYPGATVAGGATVLLATEAPRSPMLNRVVGLGVERPARDEDIDAALAAIGDDVTCYVSVEPGAEPADLTDRLRRRGLEPGWGWMTFRRGVEDVQAASTFLTLQRVGPAEAAAFGEVVTAGYELPEAVVPLVARAHEVGWDCWLALDGDLPVAAAGVFMAENVGYLGFAATLPEHRGKGAQNALLAARIRHARDHGCAVVTTETGELRAGRPSNSYRNILRAGFAEVAVHDNWLRRAAERLDAH